MRFLFFLLLAGCNVQFPTEAENCGVFLDTQNTDTWLAPVLNRIVVLTLDAAETTTDPRLQDRETNCNAMRQTRVVVRPEASWYSEVHGYWISGFADCWKGYVVIGTPVDRWGQTALFHELFHVMQACDALPGSTKDGYPQHEDWNTYGINEAILGIRP